MTTMSMALGGFLTSVATTYAKAVDRKLSTVSLAAADDPNVLPRIAAGNGRANFTIDRFDRMIRWFIEHWPPNAKWPGPPAWPFPIPTPLATGEQINGTEIKQIKKGRRGRSNGKAAQGAKSGEGPKGRKSKSAQRSGGERPA